MDIFVQNIDTSKYFIATYDVKSTDSVKQAAYEIAVGQSIGNPSCRSLWETTDMYENYLCKIIGYPDELEKLKEGIVNIAFPIANINWQTDGISHLLCTVMGGQVDIKGITHCRLVELKLPNSVIEELSISPAYGLDGMRKFTQVINRPFVGGIIKPKTGLTPEVLLEIVKELVECGVSFIKEDEILSDFSVCPIEKRVPLVMDYLKDKNVIYCVCINADPHEILKRVEQVVALGANGIHVNFWCGLGVYRSIRQTPGGDKLFIHYQQSGSRILTDARAPYSINFNVLCMLAGLCAVDSMHIGNLFGYSKETEEEILMYIDTLKKYDVIPTLSCGLTAGNVKAITDIVGIDYIANSGDYIHSHPMGIRIGVACIVQALTIDLDKIKDYSSKENYITVNPSTEIWRTHANYKILETCANLIKDKSCADIGCNHGACTHLMWDFGPIEVYGFDMNTDALKMAPSLAPDKATVFVESDATNLKCESEKFDFVVSFHTLEHIFHHDAKTVVSEMWRILRPDGSLLLSIPFEHAYPDPCHVSFYNVESLCTLLESCGFETVECFKDDRFNEKDLLTGLFRKKI